MKFGTRELTPFTLAVLDSIESFYLKNKYPPTLREIAYIMDAGSTSSIRYAMNTLSQEGYLTENVGGQARTQVPTFKPRPTASNGQ